MPNSEKPWHAVGQYRGENMLIQTRMTRTTTQSSFLRQNFYLRQKGNIFISVS